MIEQLLNKDFVLELARGSQHLLGEELQNRRTHRRAGSSKLVGVDSEIIQGLVERLAESIEAQELKLMATAERDGIPKDDLAFIPGDPVLSLLQSAVDQVTRDPSSRSSPLVQPPASRPNSRGGRPSAIGAAALPGAAVAPAPNRRLWQRMEIAKGKWFWMSDPGWVMSKLTEMWTDAMHHRSAFVDSPAKVRLDDDARIFLVGDWGSGLPRASNVAGQMWTEMLREPGRQQIVIHLGDIYYSGTKTEAVERFLTPWPVPPDSRALSFNLNGNHDMYSGGHGYYDVVLADKRFRAQGGCSYFALTGRHWQFLGLDSAYEDAGLHGRQAAWAVQQIMEPSDQETASPDRKTALLSHHQPFSAHEAGATVLRQKAGPILATGRVNAWFWGHEHRCIQYGPTTIDGHPLPFSCCLGHGGVPEYLVMKEGQTAPSPWQYEYLRPFVRGKPWERFGFAILDLKGPAMTMKLIDEDGRLHHTVEQVG